MHNCREKSETLVNNITFYQYEEVVSELQKIKKELEELKLNMASILEEKALAENQIQASSSKVMSYASSMRKIRNEMREVREEKLIKELAQIEAIRELEAIDAQRREEFEKFSVNLENTKRKINQTLEEFDRVKKMESELSAMNDDVEFLKISLEMARANGKSVGERFLNENGLESVNSELASAKTELEIIKGETIEFMASMDIIQNEIIRVNNESDMLKKAEKRNEKNVQDLNSKLLRANEKLKTVSKSEEKTRLIVSNLALDLKNQKTETLASRKEKELIGEDIEKMQELIKETESKIELESRKLDEAIHELECVKLSEAKALEELKILVESTMGARANISEPNSSIRISNFEYDYLKERAIEADMVADKKVEAAQAWVEALKVSEREILMKIEIENGRNEDIEEKKTVSKTKSAIWNQVSDDSTPVRRTRHRKSITLAGRRSSVTLRKKKHGST